MTVPCSLFSISSIALPRSSSSPWICRRASHDGLSNNPIGSLHQGFRRDSRPSFWRNYVESIDERYERRKAFSGTLLRSALTRSLMASFGQK